MKLNQLAKEPKLTKVSIDDPAIVKSYGEPIEFYVYDRVDMATFMKLANLQGEKNIADVVETMKELILNEDGSPVVVTGKVLPNDIMIKAVEKTVQTLGNFATQTSKV